eukprot:Gb_13561 [translate_table: standard]
MKKSGILLCTLVGFLGVVAAVLGFAAEVKHVRVLTRLESSLRPPVGNCLRLAARLTLVRQLIMTLLSLFTVRVKREAEHKVSLLYSYPMMGGGSQKPVRLRLFPSLEKTIPIDSKWFGRGPGVITSPSLVSKFRCNGCQDPQNLAVSINCVLAGEVKMTPSGRCLYPRNPALALGITAGLALMVAQVIVNIAAGCLCCARDGPYPPSSNRTIAIICLVANSSSPPSRSQSSITRFFPAASNVRRVSTRRTQSLHRVVQPSPIRPGLSLEDFIQQCIGSFIVVGDLAEMSSPSATITASIETLDASSSVDVM